MIACGLPQQTSCPAATREHCWDVPTLTEFPTRPAGTGSATDPARLPQHSTPPVAVNPQVISFPEARATNELAGGVTAAGPPSGVPQHAAALSREMAQPKSEPNEIRDQKRLESEPASGAPADDAPPPCVVSLPPLPAPPAREPPAAGTSLVPAADPPAAASGCGSEFVLQARSNTANAWTGPCAKKRERPKKARLFIAVNDYVGGGA